MQEYNEPPDKGSAQYLREYPLKLGAFAIIRIFALISGLAFAGSAQAQSEQEPRLAPELTAACDADTLCLTRADLALLFSARAFAEEGLYQQAQARYQKLILEHASSPFAAIAERELELLKTAPFRTGPMPLNADQIPRRPGTFTGILLGTGLASFTTLSFWVAAGSVEEPAIITTVLAGAGGAYLASRRLKAHPETLGVTDSALLGAVWLPAAALINLTIHDVDLGDALVPTVAGLATLGAGIGYHLSRKLDLHAGAVTLAWSGAVLGAVETFLVIFSAAPETESIEVIIGLCSLGSLAGLTTGALWANNRRFSAGRGRIMTIAAYGAAGLTAATLSFAGVDKARIHAAAAAASFPLGAALAYLFTEEMESNEKHSVANAGLLWALQGTEDAARGAQETVSSATEPSR